ncbi:MAG: hypothetical protein QNJ54_35395 [Prochloraceae cyanobacterium]|nr:hypothetical protein [Prochloraceae cyanobacterium]
MTLFKLHILKSNLHHFFFKFILILVLAVMISPAKADAKNKSFKEREGEVVETVQQVENTGDAILGTAKHLGIHGAFFDQILQIFDGLKAYIDEYTNKFENTWSSIEGLTGKINDSIGALKVPDPLQAGDEIIKVFSKQENDSYGIDSVTKGKNASKDFHRAYTYGQSGSVLGEQGQKVQLEESKNVKASVDISNSQAESAQSDIVTQDILKKIAIQNSQAQFIQNSLQNEEQQQTRLAAVADMNLADISENLDQGTREKQLERKRSRQQILGATTFSNGFWEERKND